jgi:hypothetical protein
MEMLPTDAKPSHSTTTCAQHAANVAKALAEQLLRYNENDLIALAAVATFFKTRQKPLADRSIEVEAKWYSLSHLWSSE